MDANFYVPKYLWAPEGKSFIDSLKDKPKEEKQKFIASLTKDEQEALLYYWKAWARPNQLPPPDDFIKHPLGWKYWLFFAGRATGKTRLAAEWVRSLVEEGSWKRIALIGPTYRDVIGTMIKGESGLESVFPPNWKLKINKQEGTLDFINPKEKKVALGLIYTGQEPERLRGPQHHFAWVDELAAFDYIELMWQLFEPGLRLGENPRAIFTTTPKASLNKISLLRDQRLVCSVGNPRHNNTNLPEGFVESILDTYEGTEIGEQEIEGKLYLDESGSLFKQNWINTNRIHGDFYLDDKTKTFIIKPKDNKEITLTKIIIAIDPSGSQKDAACECGLVLAGLGSDGYGYCIEDFSKRQSPDDYCTSAIKKSIQFGNCQIHYESNYGGELVGTVLKKVAKEMGVVINVKDIHAQKDKYQRAIPISALTQRGRIKFLGDKFHKLEQQMTTWLPGDKSPDRMDAFVWAMTVLLQNQSARGNMQTNVFGF